MDWGGSRVFCNPPYGRQIGDWVQKGYEESQKPGTLVVMLIPSRTDTSYFHDYILHGKADEIRFLRGRLKFTDEDGNAKDAAPFPSAVIVWRSPDMGQSLRDMVLELIRGEAGFKIVLHRVLLCQKRVLQQYTTFSRDWAIKIWPVRRWCRQTGRINISH